jgi:hypothetical protein
MGANLTTPKEQRDRPHTARHGAHRQRHAERAQDRPGDDSESREARQDHEKPRTDDRARHDHQGRTELPAGHQAQRPGVGQRIAEQGLHQQPS